MVVVQLLMNHFLGSRSQISFLQVTNAAPPPQSAHNYRFRNVIERHASPEVALKFKHPTDQAYNVTRLQDFDVERLVGIMVYARWRADGFTISCLSQRELRIFDWLVHNFLATTNHEKFRSDFLAATGLRITTLQEQTQIIETILAYSFTMSYGQVGNDNQASIGNAPVTLPLAQVGNDNQASNVNAPVTLPPAQDALALALGQPSSSNDNHNFHAANSMRISTSGQSRGLSDSGYQFPNSQ